MKPQSRSARRGDGAATQAQILQAAGEAIAENGVERATGKEIAERAGTNSNAINYYFGGMEGLYREVLLEAHRSLATIEELEEISDSHAPPEVKLRKFLAVSVANALHPRGPNWALRVLSREFLSPSAVALSLRDHEFLPKRQLVFAIVAGVLGRKVDDPLVEMCSYCVIAPMMMLITSDPENRRAFFPALGDGPDCARAFSDHLFTFALGGIRAAGGNRPVPGD